MKVKLLTWNVRGLNDQNKRIMVKSLMQKWKADVYCFQETKISKEVEAMAKQLWSCRWMKCGYLKAEGSCGGVLMMWDNRIWRGTLVEAGQFSITYEFVSTQNLYTWYLTGVYAPHTRDEKLLCWEEIAAVRTICDGPWATCGDFNTVRVLAERRGCSRITNVMKDFSNWIEEMELHDPQLKGGNFTWFRGANHHSAARLDRFLYSREWEETFKNIRQTIMPRVTSDHSPIMLQCGDWWQNKSYFKFENWWLKVDGFKGLVDSWWSEFVVEGCPDYKLSMKLKLLKQKLKEWSKQIGGELGTKKNKLLSELGDIDLAQDSRLLTEDELMVRATILVELEELAKIEESRWRQKSRILWLKQGDNNTRFFQRMATAHKRYNNIDRLIISGEEVKEPEDIKLNMMKC